MPSPKLTCIDIVLSGPIKKADILKRIAEELDREFETEVVDQQHRVTVTCDDRDPHHTPAVKKSAKKGKK